MIVVGSGTGGLSAAVTLSKAGKRVLVLEQHDQAGGCLHTFVDKGFEFDVGIHYIGDLGKQTITKTLVDQLTDGQVEWAPMDEAFDVVSIGVGEGSRRYPVVAGSDEWRATLYKQFPDEKAAIDKYFKLLDEVQTGSVIFGALKLLPLWVSWLLIKTKLINLVTPVYNGKYKQSTLDMLSALTDNQDLRAVLCYCWGDMGTPPSQSTFALQGLVHAHYRKMGAYYPVGGSSEFAFNMVPVVERAGGKVLVRANVEEILFEGKRAVGVRVRKGATDLVYDIKAPHIISNAGLYATFMKLLPPQISQKSYFHELAKTMKPSWGTVCGFIGFNASNEELGLKAENIWAFGSNDCGEGYIKYMDSDKETNLSTEPPLLFLSFPSAKDPQWSKHPGRECKSTATIITAAPYEWFRQFEKTTLHKRGDEYEEIKAALGDNMLEMMFKLYPQLRHHVEYAEFSTPLTNNYYLGQYRGETYGLDHGIERFSDPWLIAKLRPETDVPGLYLTGQDTFSAGITPSLFSGMATAGVVLGRNGFVDLQRLHASIRKKSKKKAH